MPDYHYAKHLIVELAILKDKFHEQPNALKLIDDFAKMVRKELPSKAEPVLDMAAGLSRVREINISATSCGKVFVVIPHGFMLVYGFLTEVQDGELYIPFNPKRNAFDIDPRKFHASRQRMEYVDVAGTKRAVVKDMRKT